MKDFLIESTIAFAVFIALYYLLFERENIHRFKRFYLLSAPVFALALPFITFVVVKPVQAEVTTKTLNIENIPQHAVTSSVTPEAIDITLIIIVIYAVITLILLARMAITLFRFRNITVSNPVALSGKTTFVLLDEDVLPHTFLQNIYLNKKDYLAGTIEPELILHEQTHAKQWHTLDILFIEILKCLLWFNPLLYLYSMAIRLNHEFLADESVIKQRDVAYYQNLLLEKASYNTGVAMASHINYSLTKKRLIMMTKKSSAVITAIKKAALLPVVAALLAVMCIDVQAQVTETPKTQPESSITTVPGEVTVDEYFAGVQFIAYERGEKDNKAENGMRTTGKKLIDKKFEDLTPEERDVFKIFLHVPKRTVKKSPTAKEFADFKNQKKYAIWIDGVNVPNAKLNNYKPNQIAYFSGSSVFKNARTKQHPQPFQYWFFTHKHFDENNMGAAPKKYGGDKVEIWVKAEGFSHEDEIVHYTELEVRPKYPGGMGKLYNIISEKAEISKNAKGNVYLEFIIEKNGAVSNITVLHSPTPKLGDAAMKAFPIIDKWSPGIKDGKPVRTKMKIPIKVN